MSSRKEYFPTVSKIRFAGSSSSDPFTYKYYNPEQMVMGRKMKDHLRFSVCFWHTFRGTGADPFGEGTYARPWPMECPKQNYELSLDLCKQRVDAAFEFFTKLGVEFYTFHDVDVAPEMRTIEESHRLLDDVTDYMLMKQNVTGVKLLWGTANLFTNKRYMCGAATNPDFLVYARAAAQVRKAMEVTVKLGGSNYVFWGGREGFSSSLNTDCRQELDHLAEFFKMAVRWKSELGSQMTLLIEPKPKEPMRHQYDYDAMTSIAFLKHYGLDSEFKLNIEPNHTMLAGHAYSHDIMMASSYQLLGSIDANTGEPDLGWDTDNFTMSVVHTTEVMRYVLKMGGLAPGGLNFDAKVRRESVDLEDIFIAHVASMDAWAQGLLCAAKLAKDGKLDAMLGERYASWKSEPLARAVEQGKSSFHELEQFAKANPSKQISGKQELFDLTFNGVIWSRL